MRRDTRRWSTSFGRWTGVVGVARVAQVARVSRWSVYGWLSGDHGPSQSRVRAIERLSGGRITITDIRRHVEVMRTVQAMDRQAEQLGPGAPELARIIESESKR